MFYLILNILCGSLVTIFIRCRDTILPGLRDEGGNGDRADCVMLNL